MMLEIVRIPCLSDNYVWLLHEPAGGAVAVVDPADPGPVRATLGARGWRLTHILNTHHHADHVGGNLALKAEFGCTIVGPRADRDRIPGIDIALGEGDTLDLGAERARVIDVPGHTRGHAAFWFEGAGALFCGDTLFALGCGRMFEGTAPQMWASLLKLRALPDATLVYCAHEYTQSTVPSPLGLEKRTNPFLRADDPALATAHGLDPRDPAAVFAHLRRSKDVFR
jgi:hydroxyacylglutathione hydrolase